MKIEEYQGEVLNEIKANSFSTGDYEANSFTAFAARCLQDASESPDIELCQFDFQLKNRKRVRIDGYAYDDVENSIVALISDYSPVEEIITITKTEIDALFSSLKTFISAAANNAERQDFPHTEDAALVAENLASNLGRASKIKLFLVTNRKLSERVKKLESETLLDKRADLAVWDLERFYQLYESSLGREDLIVDLSKWLPSGLEALKAQDDNEEVETFLAVVPGDVLAEIFDLYGSRLLEGNVRSFLSARGNVNKGIRSTILSKPELFLPFNNGITATSTGVDLDQSNGLRITEIRDLQIVNGGQTTASLYNFLKTEREKSENLRKVSVQMKLIVVSPELSEKLVPDIARFANSQNKVSEADFFSNSPFHRRMEEISKRIYAPGRNGSQINTHWFYERARGSYLNEKTRQSGVAAQTKFEQQNPRGQVIQKTDFAKYYNSWQQKPHVVSKGAQKNFLDFAVGISDRFESDAGKSDFGDEFFKKVVALKIIFDSIHKAVPKTEWYSSGYLANIVTYAMARLSAEIKKSGKELNWSKVWREQQISESLLKNLLEAAFLAHQALTFTPRTQQNVTEWAKTEACWKKCLEMNLNLSDDLIQELISASDAKENRVDERAKAKQLTEIETLQLLDAIDPAYWNSLLASARLRLSPSERSLLTKLVIPKGALLLEYKVARKALEVIERARLEGIDAPSVITS